MKARCRRPERPTKGFTLIELGIVLGVTGILAAVLLPDFVEESRSRMAEKAANDVATVIDAARWFLVQSSNSGIESNRGRWPGQQSAGECRSVASPPNAGLDELVRQRYLSTYPLNPWGQPYDVGLEWAGPAGGGIPYACNLEVDTNIPTPLADAFKSFLPLGQCNNDIPAPRTLCRLNGAVPTDYVRCCAFAPKPGIAAGPCPTGLPYVEGGVLKCPWSPP